MSSEERGLRRSRSRQPAFVDDRRSVAAAVDLARSLCAGRAGDDLSRGARVAAMVHEAGYGEDVVAAALLQAVVRQDLAELAEVESICGHEVGDLVAVLVDDRRSGSYERRMAEQRDRIAKSDRVAAALYAADQLVRIRAFAAAGRLPPRAEFRHYQRTARTLGAAFPRLPFVAEMRFELGGLTGVGSRAERDR